MRKKCSKILFVLVLGIFVLSGCALKEPEEAKPVFQPVTPLEEIEHLPPTSVATPTPVATATPTPTVTPLPTATVTPTPTVIPLPTATVTPTPTVTPSPTATPTPVSAAAGKDLYLTFDDGPSPDYTIPLLDVLETNGLSGMLVQRVIAFSVSDALVPRRVLPDDPEHVRRYVTMFGVCGLLSLVLTWHHEGFTESYSELARIGERVLSEPLFPGT